MFNFSTISSLAMLSQYTPKASVAHRPLLGPAGPRMVRRETKEVESLVSNPTGSSPVPSRLRCSELIQEKEVSP